MHLHDVLGGISHLNSLFIGQNSSGKTTNMKKYINELQGKVIVLDFGDEYSDFTDNELYLDDINPLLSKIGLLEAKALNAGYLADSHCLYKKSEEILRELKSSYPEYEDQSFEDVLGELEKEGLIEESIERLQISWNTTETLYGRILNQKIPTKKYKKHNTLEFAINKIKSSERILLKSKSMHSDHLRAVTFILLSKLSRVSNEPFHIIGDELTSFFNNGNIQLFAKTINMDNMNFILSFNKAINVPKKLIPTFDNYYIHRFESNSEIKSLKEYGIVTKDNLKKIPIGDCIVIDSKQEEWSGSVVN